MFVRRIRQRRASGEPRQYLQIVESYRREDGKPAHRVLAHLGAGDDLLFENLKAAFRAARRGQPVVEQVEAPGQAVTVAVTKDLDYLGVAAAVQFFRQAGLGEVLDGLWPAQQRDVATAKVVEALVAHRCVEAGSKLAFQRWLEHVACEQIFEVAPGRLNNTRVHRCLDELAAADAELQRRVARRLVTRQGRPRVLYLDLTDTWFEAGGGSLARRGETKAGHRSTKKINIALMVDEGGLPLRWELLPGALSETTVLPKWLPRLSEQPDYAQAVLVFDRGLPCIENFLRLLDPEEGRLFLTGIKSDAIPTYLHLDELALDALQALGDEATPAALSQACEALGLAARAGSRNTFRKDFGLVEPPKPNSRNKRRPPPMRMYVYFNPDIWRTKRQARSERLASARSFVDDLNGQLAAAKRSRQPGPIRSAVTERLRKLKLLECHEVELEPLDLPGRTKAIRTYQVKLRLKEDALRNMQRYDGLSLLLAHPEAALTCDEAISIYRQKNVVEAGFRTIKSVLDLRPTFHWTDHKIQAHVTLCVLALLVDRLIEERLANAPHDSAASALAALGAVHLHQLAIDGIQHSCLTTPSPDVRTLAATLGLSDLLTTIPTKVTHRSERA